MFDLDVFVELLLVLLGELAAEAGGALGFVLEIVLGLVAALG
jgi:hypothetical protein